MKLLFALACITLSFILSFWVMMSGWGLAPKDWGVIIVGNILTLLIGAVGQNLLKSGK